MREQLVTARSQLDGQLDGSVLLDTDLACKIDIPCPRNDDMHVLSGEASVFGRPNRMPVPIYLK
ncbi:MAG: hypothetical protein KGN30_15860, partial [Nitrospirota bacterium]|nr:hypothetical protein [Nitrospirota bacterium]